MAEPQAVLALVEDLEEQIADVLSGIHEDMAEGMQTYREQVAPIMARRNELASGKAPPSDVELEGFTPAGTGRFDMPPESKPKEEDDADDSARIPFFWLSAMMSIPQLASQITKKDKYALEYLEDVTPVFRDSGMVVEFRFRENPYFYNQVLRRGVFVVGPGVMDPDEEQETLALEQSTTIDWKDGMCLTQKEVIRTKTGGKKNKKGKKNEANAGKSEFVTTLKPCKSFFNFFAPLGKPTLADIDPTMEEEVEVDVEDLKEQHSVKQEQDVAILNAITAMLAPCAGTEYQEHPIYSLAPPTANEDDEASPAEDDDDFEIIDGTPASVGALPVAVQKQIYAMSKVQAQMDALLQGFKAIERESTWHGYTKFRELCDHRRELLVAGGDQPTSTEADSVPEGADVAVTGPYLTIPKYWILSLMAIPQAAEVIQKQDERILCHLCDIRFVKPQPPSFQTDPPPTMATGVLELEFLPNPFMKQTVVKKTYYLERDQIQMGKAEEIVWNEGCDPTVKVGKDGRARVQRSFFGLFKAGGEVKVFGLQGNNQETVAEAKELETDLLNTIRQELTPSTLEKYSMTVEQYGPDGGLGDDDEDEEEDEEEEVDSDADAEGAAERREERRAVRAARAAQKAAAAQQGFRMTRGMWLMLLLVLFVVADVFIFLDTIMGQRPGRR